MNAWDELVARCAQRRREKIGPLSDQAFEELLLAVRERPADFVDSPSEQAVLELARALDAYRASRQDDDLLDDDAFRAARERRLLALASACDRAAAIDEGCLDARLVALLAREEDPDALLGSLVELERGASAPVPEGGGDAWDDVWCRPRLRLRAAIARTCLDGARHRMARTAAASLLAASPRDELGARHTEMLACARLEDEAGLGELDARFAPRSLTSTSPTARRSRPAASRSASWRSARQSRSSPTRPSSSPGARTRTGLSPPRGRSPRGATWTGSTRVALLAMERLVTAVGAFLAVIRP